MKDIGGDLRFALRNLLRYRGLTLVALLLLVLGIGSSTAIFTLLNAVFLQPLPVTDPHEVVAVYGTVKGPEGIASGFQPFSYPNYRDLRDRNRVFSGLALYQPIPMNLSGADEPVRVTGMVVSANYFDLLGTHTARGRFFLPEEDRTPGTHPVAVLSHGCWQRYFGADPELIGKTVTLNGHSLTVVGIAPSGFQGTQLDSSADVWVPSMLYQQLSSYGTYFNMREARVFWLFGRLAPGITRQRAEAEMNSLARQLEEEFPEKNKDLSARLLPLLEGTVYPPSRGRYVTFSRTLTLAVGMLLLIACLHLAKLLLVRGLDRRREMALRQVLGASPRRLLRQLLVETLLLFLLGAVLSLPVARGIVDLLWSLRPPELTASGLVPNLDNTVLGFTLLSTLVTSLLFGLLPVLSAARPKLVEALKDVPNGGRPGTPVRASSQWLVITFQVALTLVVLIGSDVFLQSLRNARQLDLGFEPEKLLVMTLAPGDQGYEEARVRIFYRQVTEQVEALPGVRGAALSQNRLLRGSLNHYPLFLEGHVEPLRSGSRTYHRVNVVGPAFFATVGMPLVAGRDFDSADRADTRPVAIINETMAKQVWPDVDAIGQRFLFDPAEPAFEVVGVTRDAKYRHIHEEPQFFIYLPLGQNYASAMTLHVRTEGDPAARLESVRHAVQELDPHMPLAEVDTMSRFVSDALWLERLLSTLLSSFALLALGLVVVGLYGVLSYSAHRRRREIAVRRVLGATRPKLLAAVLGSAVSAVGSGVVLGWLVASFVVAPLISSQLHGIGAINVTTYTVQALVVLAAALIASYVPARRAAGTNPASVLRLE